MLRPLLLEPPQGNAGVVQEGGAVDFFVERIGIGCLDGAAERFEGGEVRGERFGAEASVANVVRENPGLTRCHRIEVPAQIEVRALQLAKRS